MAPETLFTVANGLAACGWLLLIFAPRKRWSRALIAPVVIPLLLAIAYTVLAARYFAGAEGGFSSLADVALLFENPWILLAGWIHYLAFDLFVGAWEVRDAEANRIPHLAVVPCLILTFLLGPAGLLLFLIIRAAVRRQWVVE